MATVSETATNMSIHPFTPRAIQAMPTLSWQGRLDAATTSDEVVSVARDYLANFSPYELVVLPKSCKPPHKLYDSEEVTTYAFTLVRHECHKEQPAVADLVHKLAHFFSNASIRLSEIQSRPADEQDTRQSA
ncbi:MAG TPA: hypothetical protein VM122_11270 [Usitatibacter sp.]|nr:hypothetical protein [Usitatibacter sp.]